MKRVRIKVFGKVQGVFFRYSAKELADRLGVRGFAKNNFDGTVEILAEGNDAEVNQIVEFCKQGPEMSRVDKIELKEEKVRGDYDKFEIK